MNLDSFQYSGRRALVIGGATGMGAATTRLVSELGGSVVVMDVAEIDGPAEQKIRVDLREKASLDAAVEQASGSFDAVFCCAGVADGVEGLIRINYLGQRYLVDRLLERDSISRGGAIGCISSVAGLGWQMEFETLSEFIQLSDWDAAVAWTEAHEGTDQYLFSKKAVNAWVAQSAFSLIQKGIRINAIEPGPTDTPLARANAEVWLGFSAEYNKAAGLDALRPEDMAAPLAFLCSPAARGINGISFLVDNGQINSGITVSFGSPLGG